ncbi:MAG TPA: acyltransferase domain-containing protein [Candidatus Acidoferrum sp.]|nr:acyltransferase domain-containing protein [Candidatus Acidoferrum sp.]
MSVLLAFLFPGQGSQYPDMLARVASDPRAAATFEEAQRVLGYDVRDRDDVAALASTINVQLGLLVAGVASARVLEAHNVHPDAVAGHSVGGFAAAVVTGAMQFADALLVVGERARTMERLFPSGYGMGVIAGIQERVVREIVRAQERAGDRVYLANVNAPTQCVIAGERDAITRALEAGTAAGARRADRLDVAVPSHCPLLAPVRARLEEVLADVRLRDPEKLYVGSVGPRVIRDAGALRDDLAAGVAHEVRWHDASTMLVEMGATMLIETIPGHVLTDLAQQAFPHVRAIAFDDAGAQAVAARVARA